MGRELSDLPQQRKTSIEEFFEVDEERFKVVRINARRIIGDEDICKMRDELLHI